MIIHLEDDQTLIMSAKITLTAYELVERADQIYYALARTDWEGPSKDEFLNELYQRIAALKTLSDQLDFLGFQLKQEIDQWHETAWDFPS
jgi:hypothetical protein